MWKYKEDTIESIENMPKSTFGFIYEVTHTPSGRKYIGKKVLYFERNKKLGIRALEELRLARKAKGIGGRTPLKQKIVTESDWKTYYGSHKEIMSLIKENKQGEFTREILQFVPTKKQLTYFECKYLFIKEALEGDDYINDNVLAKFYRKDFEI
jgi:serine/threonine protein kinase